MTVEDDPTRIIGAVRGGRHRALPPQKGRHKAVESKNRFVEIAKRVILWAGAIVSAILLGGWWGATVNGYYQAWGYAALGLVIILVPLVLCVWALFFRKGR